MSINEPVRPLTAAELLLVAKIDLTWSRNHALSELRAALQTAIEIELATIPVYLYAYYSIDRTPNSGSIPTSFPHTPLSRFADKAGATIMSVVVEEMLHMSLGCNMLHALGQQPQLYLRSPSPFPSNLPGHSKLAPDGKKMAVPLAKLSFAQLGQFLDIEYPASADAPPESSNWDTIGQIYSYIRCIISSCHIKDSDFQVGAKARQIGDTNYSPNNIDTVFPNGEFNSHCPAPAGTSGAASGQAVYTNAEDSHSGNVALMTIDSCARAMKAIQTIDSQGEGYGPSKFDDKSQAELSHYYKFLELQSQLQGYNPNNPALPPLPQPPAAAALQFSPEQLSTVVYNFPDNPVAASYPPGRSDLANLISGLYQYMLIMTESIFLHPPEQQKLYFNLSLHRSMIWILDKLIRNMRQVNLFSINPSSYSARLAPTFENVNLGPRDQAFANLCTMCKNLDATYGDQEWYTTSLQRYANMILTLPDVSALWQQQPTTECDVSKYQGIPKFPATPPATLAPGEQRHTCMGLNSCKNQGRTRDNACAGQGYCSTALAYNYAEPSAPKVSDHTCMVQNACKGQGGCGLYGTGDEQLTPGANNCAGLGGCATPINAERFSTNGPNRGKGVWARAREVFVAKTWPNSAPPPVPHPELFQYGPTIEWIRAYSGETMTACGASGMSGANRCS